MSNSTNKYVTPVGLQQPAAADLSDGTTGSGAVVLATSPTLATPTLGVAVATTPSTADNSTKVATTAYVQAQGYVTGATAPVVSVAGKTGAVTLVEGDISNLTSDLALKAPLASPTFTGTPAGPTAALGTNTTQLATTAFVLANSPGSTIANWLAQGRLTRIMADGTTTTFHVSGDVITLVGAQGGGSPLAVAPTANIGPAIATFSSGVGVATSYQGNLNYRVGKNIRLYMDGGPARTNNERVWWGLTDQTAATMSASDNPAGNYAAFRYSTVAGDTHYQCITKDGSTQTVVDSGVTPLGINVPANSEQFAIIFQDGTPNVLFYIHGNLVATIATHLPTSGTNTRFFATQLIDTNTTNSGFYLSFATVGMDAF